MTDYTNLRKIVTGDIIVKCRYGNDIRRIPINQAPTYDELCIMMNRVFKGKIKFPNNIMLKYTDDEGDLINLSDDNDITHAISISNLLKITVYDELPTDQSLASLDIQRSLIEIQGTLDKILKSFDNKKQLQEASSDVKSPSQAEQEKMKTTRSLASSELASFDTVVSRNSKHGTEASIANELATLSPGLSVTSASLQISSTQQQEQEQQQRQPPAQAQPTSQPLPLQQQPPTHGANNNNQQANQPPQFARTQQPQESQSQVQQHPSYPPWQQPPPSSTAFNNQYTQPQHHPKFHPQAQPLLSHPSAINPPSQQRPPCVNPLRTNVPPIPVPTNPPGLQSQQTGTSSNIASNSQQLPPQFYRPPTNW